jgi:uncharacterized protein (UPF0264 family)
VKLLVSPQNTEEAKEAIAGGADIIDIKNPKEGPLGANFPWVIKEIKAFTPRGRELSCTLGEAPNLPGSMSLAACGAASLGVDYVKVGLCGVNTLSEAISLLQNVTRAAKECNPKIRVVAAGYADHQRANTIDSLLVPEAAFKAKADLAMLDTSVKDGKNLFDFLTTVQLQKFVDLAHGYGLCAALAGSLRKQDLPVLYELGVDVAGLRGAACTNSNRVTGHITREKVQELVEVISHAASKEKRF